MLRRCLTWSIVCAALLSFGGSLNAADPKPLEVPLADFSFTTASPMKELLGYNADEKKIFFYVLGTAAAKVKVAAEAEYEVIIKASCDKANKEFGKFKLLVDDKLVEKEVTLKSDSAEEYTLKVKLTAGEHKLAIEDTADLYKEGEYDMNLYIHAVALKPVK